MLKNHKIKRRLLIAAAVFAVFTLFRMPAYAADIPMENVPELLFDSQTGVFSQSIAFGEADTVWYSYTPEATGYDMFTVERAFYEIYDSAGEEIEEAWQGYLLAQGETYYFCFTTSGDGASSDAVAPKIEIHPVIDWEGGDYQTVVKGTVLELVLQNQPWVQSVAYESSDTGIVSVKQTGKVKALASGTETISAEGTTQTGEPFRLTMTIRVIDPKLDKKTLSLNLYFGTKIAQGDDKGYYMCRDNELCLQDVTEEDSVKVCVRDENGKKTGKVRVAADYYYYRGEYMIYLYPKKIGTYTVEADVNGKLLTCKLKVFKLYFAREPKTVADNKSKKWVPGESMAALYPGETAVLSVKGYTGKVKWSSNDKSVAKVDAKGKVTAKRAGYAAITARCGDCEIEYLVGVAEKQAVLALRECFRLYGSLKYSQPLRMSSGYADCSSFIWKGYKAAGLVIGNQYYAPTAAGISDWCLLKGYRLFYGEADVDALLPGDLICWCGADNGRSDGIYHVDIYQGNYKALTVEREKTLYGTLTNVAIARPCKRTTSGVAVKANAGRTLTVTWNKLYGVSGYAIYQSTSANGTYTKVAAVKGDSRTEWTSGKLTAGKTYYYKIRPYWKANKVSYSADYTQAACAKVKK